MQNQTISTILRNASVFDIKNWREVSLNNQANFQGLPDSDSVSRLFEAIKLQKINNYLLVGGIAMLNYNYIDGRNTEDIDLVFDEGQIFRIDGLEVISKDQDFCRAKFENIQIDLLLTKNKVFKYVLQYCGSRTSYADATDIAIASPKGLIILKLYALPSLYHKEQFDRATLYESDITQLLRKYPVTITEVLKPLKPPVLLDSDLEEVKNIFLDIQSRIDKERDRFSKFI
ncbi:MAG: hypothetical protein ACKO7R_05495 [Pseudanabaena sp.]